MGDLLGGLLVIAALLGIYAFMFRGIFGKSRGTSLFAKGKDRPGDGPAWGTALMGGFAVGQMADVTGWAASSIIALAVVVGVSAALGKTWNPLSLPAAAVGYAATVFAVVGFVVANPQSSAWGVLFAVVLLVVTGDLIRWAVKFRRGVNTADKAMAYFAAIEAALFLASPGGVPFTEVLQQSMPVGQGILALVIALAPLGIGLLGAPFLAMFSLGIALAGLWLEYAGYGSLGFIGSVSLLAAALLSYWFVRWIIRGFGGAALLED